MKEDGSGDIPTMSNSDPNSVTNPVALFTIKNIYRDAAKDLWQGLKHWRIWNLLAWNTLQQRYKRTWLGIGWVGLSFALFAVVKIFVFAPMMNKELVFYGPFLVIGFLFFRLITNFITNGCSVFLSAGTWIKTETLPLSVHLYKLVSNNLIVFSMAAIPSIIICFIFRTFGISTLFVLPLVLIVYVINGICVSVLLGVMCARYRDIMHFVTTIMQIMFFITPILWVPPETGLRAIVANLNPLTHYIKIIRHTALYGEIPWHSWQIVGVITVALIIISFLTFARGRHRLVYWL